MLSKIPTEKIIKTALSKGGDFAEIFAERSEITSIAHENRKIERASTGVDAGYGIRLTKDGCTSYGFTNDPDNLLEIASSLSGTPSDIKSLKKNKPQNSKSKAAEDIDKKIEIVSKAANAAWLYDKCVRQVQIVWRNTIRDCWVVNSRGVNGNNRHIDTVLVAMITTERDGIVQTGYEPVGGPFNLSYFDGDKSEEVSLAAVKRAILMLNAGHAPSGPMQIVISSEAGGTMIHEAVGHGLEADIVHQGISIYKDKIGSQVASKLVTVVDDATIPGLRGSYKFDDEGKPGEKTVLIEDGILKTYMHDLKSSKKDAVNPTGNGRRESYRNRPIVRMTNTLIVPGKDDPESIIKSVGKGLFAKRMGGGQVNTLNGDFVFEAQEAYLIENGKIGEPVRGATLIGNGPKILMEIDMVGTDLGYGIGTCGKEGQGVPVGHGMPTIRIPNITVGGTA